MAGRIERFRRGVGKVKLPQVGVVYWRWGDEGCGSGWRAAHLFLGAWAVRGGVTGRPELTPLYWYLAFFSDGFRIWEREKRVCECTVRVQCMCVCVCVCVDNTPEKNTLETHPHSSFHRRCQTPRSSLAQRTEWPTAALQRTHNHLQPPAKHNTLTKTKWATTWIADPDWLKWIGTWWALQIRSRSWRLRNLLTTSAPKVNETPRSFSPHPWTSLSGSDHSKSHSNPVRARDREYVSVKYITVKYNLIVGNAGNIF